MKILIIGVKGFIGSQCAAHFEKDHDTWGCDVFTDYNEKNFLLIDTLNPSYHDLFRQGKFDVCINCAGTASVGDSLKYPERDYELNALLVYKLLESIRRFNPECQFVNLSSAAVYGNPTRLPIPETERLEPVSPYGLHKMYAEQICREFAQHFFLRTCSVRIFSAFGPGLKKQIFWDLYRKSKSGDTIELFGGGKETRDYVFISDIIQALRAVIQRASFQGEAYNLGTGKSHTVEDVAQQFLSCIKWKGKLVFSGIKRQGDPDAWQADISKLESLGYKPEVMVAEGIRKYAEWTGSLP